MEQKVKKTFKIGEEFEVVLGENISAGYELHLDYSDDFFDISESYEPHTVSPEIIGMGEKRIFKVKTKKEGNGKIEFSYKQPWEKNSTAYKIIYEIDVKND